MDTLISIKNIDFNYHNSVILENISLDIKKGQNLAILGRNGGGKSTLVKLILGFLKPSSGSIEYIIDKNKLGYLPQIREFDTTFPINLFDLVISGLTNNKNFFSKFSSLDKEKTVNLMNEFEILELKDKHINEVSGGQLQRALIARAIISEPELIFLDEPESFLDKEFEEKLYTKIKSLKKYVNISMQYVSLKRILYSMKIKWTIHILIHMDMNTHMERIKYEFFYYAITIFIYAKCINCRTSIKYILWNYWNIHC